MFFSYLTTHYCWRKKYFMQNSQLIAALKTFSKKENREFRKWLLSPFHNQRQDVIDLFDYFQKNDHLEKEHFQTKTKIYSKIFPGQRFDDAKIRQTIHFLQKQVDQYLTYCELHQDETGSKIALLRAYRKKQLEKAVNKNLRVIKNFQDNYPYRDFTFLWNQYLLQREVHEFYIGQSAARNSLVNIQEMADALDKVYFSMRMKQSCAMLAHRNVFKTEYNDGLIEQIISFVADNQESLLQEPAISFYYHGYFTYPSTKSENANEYFFKLKENILSTGHLFPVNEIQDLLSMASNYCIRCVNQGKSEFLKEAFELYKYGVENDILIKDKKNARWDFMNIVRIGSQIKEAFDWVSWFIETFQDRLSPEERANIVHFCKSKLYYAQGRYDASMKELSMVREDDILLNISSKHTLLKIYYEKDEFEPLESLVDSMSKYIRRKDVPSNYRKVYESIIRLIRKMIRTNPYNKDQVKNLKEEIQSTPALPFSDREWFLKQIASF